MDEAKDETAGDEAMPYGVDTIRLRISFPAAPVSRGYNGRMWRMRPLRGWTGGAQWDAREAARRGGERDGSVATSSDHAPTHPGGDQAVPVSQALEGGGPASELLAAFRAQRIAALQGRGLAANGAETASDAARDMAGRDGGGPGGAPPMTPAALPSLDMTSPGAPITTADPDPYASSDLGGTTVRLGTIVLTPPAPVTADQLRAIMPHAGAEADRYVDALNQAMAAHGINTPEQRAAFLAQVSAETGQLQHMVEDMNYSARRIHQVWPRLFSTEAEAAPYAHNPEALANRVYTTVNGNRDEASGDGYRFRGRGFAQTTDRDNYRAVGFENNPEALAEPQNAANSAAAYWQSHGLNGQTTRALNRVQFDAVSRTINGGDIGSQERWSAYQRGLHTLHGGR